MEETARAWAAEIADLVRAAGGAGARLAIDVCDPAGLQALQALDVQLLEGRELTEKARMLKSADELELMRWTVKVCDAAIQRMYDVSAEPGRTELEIWAELHHENIRNGGEWDRDAPPDLGAAHQPVVPGGVAAASRRPATCWRSTPT